MGIIKSTLLPVLYAAFFLAACSPNGNVQPEPDPSQTPAISPSMIASATALPVRATETATASRPIVASPTRTSTSTQTFTPSPTPGHYEHTVRQGETLGFIIQIYGYNDFNVIDEIVSLNPNIVNADQLPGEGAIIFIPRQTITPTLDPLAQDDTATRQPNIGEIPASNITKYTVQEGDALVGIAQRFNTTLEILAQLNPEIPFFGCNFELLSGGPNCNPPLQVGQLVCVPIPTPTPTSTPTPSGIETPTATPTYFAPVSIFPPDGAILPASTFRLQWVTVGILAAGEVYLVEIRDTTTETVFRETTRSTTLQIPDALLPNDGQTHNINWSVSVAKPNEEGVLEIISGTAPIRSFQWQSR